MGQQREVRAGGKNPQEKWGKDFPLKLRIAWISFSVQKMNSGTGGALEGGSSLYKIIYSLKKPQKMSKKPHNSASLQLKIHPAKYFVAFSLFTCRIIFWWSKIKMEKSCISDDDELIY